MHNVVISDDDYARPSPRWFAQYLLLERMAEGGMAEVWRARDPDGATVVIKRVLPALADTDEVLAMFRHEARLSARLEHPGVVRVLEAGEHLGEPFLAMELCEGRNLSQVLSRVAARGLPAVGFGAYVVREICGALAYVHALTDEEGECLRLLHRDVSPANVMVGFDGSVKLLDFGIAKALTDETRPTTEVGILKGKIGYLAPEAVDGAEVDERSDQFAAGVILHEALTVRRLFKAATDLETAERVQRAEVPAPSLTHPGVSPELDRICVRALARRPADRFVDCGALKAALTPLVEAEGWSAETMARLMAELFAAEELMIEPDPVPTDALERHTLVEDFGGWKTPRGAPESGLRWAALLAAMAFAAALVGGALAQLTLAP